MPLAERESVNTPINLFQANSEKWTFQDDTVRAWVEERLNGDVLNVCAGKTQLRHSGDIHRNDINEKRNADTHYDAKSIADELDCQFDTIVYDPPWSVFQVNDKYEGRGQDTIKQSTVIANQLDELLRDGGKILCFGYTLNMIPSSLRYEITEAAVFTIPGPGKDFFGSVQRRKDSSLTQF